MTINDVCAWKILSFEDLQQLSSSVVLVVQVLLPNFIASMQGGPGASGH